MHCRKSIDALDYDGKINVTRTGKPCLYWNSTRYPTQEKNYCRTPPGDGDNAGGPWCYIKTGWERCNVPVCNSRYCPEFKNTNVLTLDGKERYQAGETVFLKCKNGGNIKGTNALKCLSQGRWNSSEPSCNDCRKSIDALDYDGKINVTRTGKPCLYWNSTRYPTQEKNYCRTPPGDGDNAGGPWCYIKTGWERCNVPVCNSQFCPKFTDPNLQTLDGKVRYREGETVYLNCKDGYNLRGARILKCLENGKWNYGGPIPSCEEIEFADPNLLTLDGKDRYQEGETVHFKCKDGYIVKGQPFSTCSHEGVWNSNLLSCKGIPCQTPNVTNMIVLQKEYIYPESFNVTCNEGYESKLKMPVNCTANGTMSRTPECIGTLCHTLNAPNMKPLQIEYRFPANITVSCIHGYKSDLTDPLFCVTNGSWSRTPKCIGIPCQTPNVTNMIVLQKEYRYPESFNVTCNEGYESKLKMPVNCTADGTMSRTPECIGIQCKPIPKIINALNTNLTYRYLEQLTIECEPGYIVNTTEPIGCSTNGEWTKPLPVCVEVLADSSPHLGPAIGGTVGGIVAIITVVVVVVIIIYRRNIQRKSNGTVSYNKPIRKENKAQSSTYDDICMKDEEDATTKICHSNKDETYYNIQNEEDSGGYYAFTEGPQMPKTAVLIDNFYDYVERRRNEGGEIETEFGTFKNGLQDPTTVALKPGNKAKNKYRNLYAYDNTRVLLKKKTPTSSDYINASFINGYGEVKKYIAAQGPLGNTVDDFWEMVFQFDCGKIVMLTNVFEEGKEKCIVYWPETVGSSTTFGSVKLTLTKEEIFSDLTIRTLMLHQEGKEKMIKQLHFTAWPDKDVPKYSSSLVHFRYKVNAYKSTSNGPTVVHCSAGIGRTGTFIALDYVVTEALAVGYVDVYGCVEGLRRQRVNMVQTAKQYVFLHEAVLEALMCPNSGIPSKDFPEAYKNLMKFDQEKKKHKLQLEYEIMNSLAQRHEEDSFDKGKMAENKPKNRYSNIIPVRSETPMLLTRVEGRNDYINAVFLPGYRSSRAFIITQMPLEDTKVDLWRLIHDYNISTVVMLNIEHDKRDAYWPEGTGCSVDIGPFRIDQTKFEEKQLYNVRHLTYQYKRTNEKTMTLVQQTFWKDRKACPDSVDDLVNLISGAEDVHGKSNSEGPMLIHCLNGCDKSGLYCVMATVIERLRIEQDIDIQHVIKQMRNRRPQIIPNYEQYQFVYDAVIDYLKEFETYSNFS